MVIKSKLKGLNSIYLSTITCSKSTTGTWCKPCSKLTTETPKQFQRCCSDVSIANFVANFEHVIIGQDISLKVSKQLTVLGHSMLLKIV